MEAKAGTMAKEKDMGGTAKGKEREAKEDGAKAKVCMSSAGVSTFGATRAVDRASGMRVQHGQKIGMQSDRWASSGLGSLSVTLTWGP